MSIDMEPIENFLRCRKFRDEVIAPRKKKARTAKVTLPKATTNEIVDATIPLPTDTATMIYTKPEAVRILAQTQKKTKERSAMMEQVVLL